MFQVSYNQDWHALEMIPFIFIGIAGVMFAITSNIEGFIRRVIYQINQMDNEISNQKTIHWFSFVSNYFHISSHIHNIIPSSISSNE